MNDDCATCGAFDVRLYRIQGEFFNPADIRCASCAREEVGGQEVKQHSLVIGLYAPLIRSERNGGDPWGFQAIPQADLDAWFDLPEV